MIIQYQKSLCLVFLSISAFTLANSTYANTQPLNAQMKVFQVELKQKKELKATDQIKPNTLLEYKVEYSNVSVNTLKNLKLNLPLPEHVTYIGQSLPKDVYASVDGKNFAKAPLTRIENGKKINIPLREYRALQWNVVELNPKQKTVVSAQVRVNAPE